MKLFENQQQFMMSGRFSAQQRRFGWDLLKHPKAARFRRRCGAKWQMIEHHEGFADMTVEQMRQLREKETMRLFSLIQAIAEERRRRGLNIADLD